MNNTLSILLCAFLSLSCANGGSGNEKQNFMDKINELGNIFSEMVENHESFRGEWRNIPLGKKAFAIMRDELPLRVEGELTPYTRIVLLDKMLSCMPERDCARFFLEVQQYQLSLFPLISDADLKEDMDIDAYDGKPEEFARQYTEKLHRSGMLRMEDYLNPEISMEEWCLKYHVNLKFDPVERSEQWENCIYDVEKECESKLEGERRGMGFCYSYWSTKKSVLSKHGIDWSSPAAMNPRVMFD